MAQFQGYYFLRSDGDGELVCVVATPDAGDNIGLIEQIELMLDADHGVDGWFRHYEDLVGDFVDILEANEGEEESVSSKDLRWHKLTYRSGADERFKCPSCKDYFDDLYVLATDPKNAVDNEEAMCAECSNFNDGYLENKAVVVFVEDGATQIGEIIWNFNRPEHILDGRENPYNTPVILPRPFDEEEARYG